MWGAFPILSQIAEPVVTRGEEIQRKSCFVPKIAVPLHRQKTRTSNQNSNNNNLKKKGNRLWQRLQYQ
jgi:hypothetical protein